MVPRNRLLFWTAVIVLPFTAAAPSVPGASVALATFFGVFVLVVGIDAVLGRRRLRSVRVQLPELLRWQKGRTEELPLAFQHPLHQQTVRVGLPLPPAFGAEEPVQTVLLASAAGHSRYAWPCVVHERGQFFLGQAYLEMASPLGFWNVRRAQATACEVRVYPNLYENRRQNAALFLRRTLVGAHTQRHVGQGREFEKLRTYQAGDPWSDIHWKASAKRGALVSRVHQIERTHEVYVAIDASRLSARRFPAEGPQAVPALERYVSAALLLARAAEQQGDQFGLITFADRVLHGVRARAGQAHFSACREALLTLQTRKVSPDFEELFTFLRLRIRKRALLIVLTALDDPVLAESFSQASQLVSRQHLLLVDLLQPAEVRPLFAPELEVAHADEVYARLAGHLRWQQMRELQKVLQRRGVRLSFLDPEQLATQMIAQHAEVRARQLI